MVALPVDPRRRKLEDQLHQVEVDLADLEAQIASGELDDETAQTLRATYRAEAAGVAERLTVLDEGPAPQRRSGKRAIVGAAVLLLGLGLLTVFVAGAVEPRPPGGLVTGGIVSDVVAGGGRDLSTVTNEELEAVIAANPEVVDMRLALARRYFGDGDFSDALRHYMVVLETGPNAEALANVGWMAHGSGESETGLAYVEQALLIDPGYTPALWYLANIRFDLGDRTGTVEAVDLLIAATDVPDDVRAAAEELRTAAGSGS